MKKIILLVSLLVVVLFVVSCAPAEEVSDAELEDELGELSDAELDEVIEASESEGDALVGQAYSKYKRIPRASKQRVLTTAYKLKSLRSAECIWQDYAGGIKDCGIKSEGNGRTINCKYQKYAGGLE